MSELPQPGQKVHWRDLRSARAWGWVEVFGPGPFEVVRLVDRGGRTTTTGLLLRTELGEREIDEVWLALADEPSSRMPPCQQVVAG
jgi:hypothetical protein